MQGRVAARSACRHRGRCSLRCAGRRSLSYIRRSERGGALIEIMMSALLVALAATAVFKGIDGASAVSGASKSRAVAASIAEDDQERLRALPPAELVDRTDNRTLARNNVNYTIQSSVRWIADRNATPDCNTVTSRAGYLRIRSEVSWPDMRGSKPIVASSLVAAPNGTVSSNWGAAGIKILNEAQQGVPGVTVSISGVSPSKVTDANGCAHWDEVPAGNYSYTASKAGYVDYEGDTSITRPIGVAGGQTRLDTAYLDAAQDMNVSIVTRRYGGAERSAEFNDFSGGLPLHLTNSKMAGLNGDRVFPGTTSSTRLLTGLYPMNYGVFVGECTLANNPGLTAVSVPYPNPTKIWMPAINVRGRINGTYENGRTIKYTLQPVAGSTCTTTYTRTTTNVVGVGDGAIARPEMPYGTYVVCGEAQYAGTWYRAQRTVNNTNTAGTSVLLDDSIAEANRRC